MGSNPLGNPNGKVLFQGLSGAQNEAAPNPAIQNNVPFSFQGRQTPSTAWDNSLLNGQDSNFSNPVSGNP